MLPARRVAFVSFGCKLNQTETEAIAQNFIVAGYLPVGWKAAADLYIINSCTVTSKAEQKTRRLIRKILADHPEASVIVTGCYAQLDPERLAAVAGHQNDRLFIIPGAAKAGLLDLPAKLADSGGKLLDCTKALINLPTAAASDHFRFEVNNFTFHSRASLKIQDGCDNHCSYCRVRLARGRSLSLAASEAVRRLQALEARGYAEVVLTGLNILAYDDPVDGLDLVGLLRRLLAETNTIALRLSSLEPQSLTDAFIKLVAHRRIRPHFHLSIQSASDTVLARMRRPYLADQAIKVVEGLRSATDDPFLACDLIVGFPGETADDFRRSYDFCLAMDFAAIHAFPYSPRPGTEAYSFRPAVPERIAVARAQQLKALAASGRRAYAKRWFGRTVEAVAERPKSFGTALVTANYLNIWLKEPLLTAGLAYCCRLEPPGCLSERLAPYDAEAVLVET